MIKTVVLIIALVLLSLLLIAIGIGLLAGIQISRFLINSENMYTCYQDQET